LIYCSVYLHSCEAAEKERPQTRDVRQPKRRGQKPNSSKVQSFGGILARSLI